MSSFNFLPSIMGVRFYRGERGFIEDENIDRIILENYSESNGPDVFEFGMELTVTGLDKIKNPYYTEEFINHPDYGSEEKYEQDMEYETFYINIAHFTVRGAMDSIVHGLSTTYINTEIMKKGTLNLLGTITKIRNDERSFVRELSEGLTKDFEYDFVDNYFSVRVFYSKERITIDEYIENFYNGYYPVLFETKIPVELPKVWGNSFEG